MQAAGCWEQQQQGLEDNTYVHPNDDSNCGGANPMTMAMDTSRTYSVDFGNA
jgi:hypothetical protein